MFLGGDFSCTANATLDRAHPEPHGASKSCLVKLIEANDLCDAWRPFHHTQCQYTWVHAKDNCLSIARPETNMYLKVIQYTQQVF